MVLYFTDLEAVLHVEILSCAGGDLVVVFQHLFQVTLVDGWRSLPVAAVPPLFYGDFWPSHDGGENWRKPAQFDKIETPQDRF